MMIPKDYAIFPRELLQNGSVLMVSVYVYLPQNQSMLLFRKPDSSIGPEDIESFQKIPTDRLLYLRAENDKVNEMRKKLFTVELESGNVNSPSVKAVAASMLQSFATDQDLAKTMDQAAQMVQELLKGFKKSASGAAYDAALRKMSAEKQKADPLALHHNNVSTIAVLMALNVGDFSMDDLADLATAGLLHDLGLKDITKSLADAHFHGIKKFDNQEKIIYMRHLTHSLEQIKKEKLSVTPGVIRIIEHHHENWDGSGFRSCLGTKIYRPARILRMADDLISLVQEPVNHLGFQQAMTIMKKELGMYDPDMMKEIAGVTG